MIFATLSAIILHIMGIVNSVPILPIPPTEQQLLNRFCSPQYVYPNGEEPYIGRCVAVPSKNFFVDQNSTDPLFSRCRKVT